jgi:hypothetical protein
LFLDIDAGLAQRSSGNTGRATNRLATLGVCQEVAGEETVSPAACLLSGQEDPARRLDDHPKWKLDKVRCALGNRRVANSGGI